MNDAAREARVCDATHCEFAYIQELAQQLLENSGDNRIEALALSIQLMTDKAWQKLEAFDALRCQQ